jgi:hypothetical protein
MRVLWYSPRYVAQERTSRTAYPCMILIILLVVAVLARFAAHGVCTALAPACLFVSSITHTGTGLKGMANGIMSNFEGVPQASAAPFVSLNGPSGWTTIYQVDRYLRISLMSAMNIIICLMAIKSFQS